MAYTNPDTLQEVANILDDFDEETIVSLFKAQILQEESYINIPINHFDSLYLSYKRSTSIENVEPDDIEIIKNRFQTICISIIECIQSKYDIQVDFDWIESQYGNLPALTFTLYHFFIIDIFYVILAVLNNYIARHSKELYEAFSAMSTKKDVSSVTNQKTLTPIYATIVSNLFDVTDYIFTMLDNEALFEYLNPEYESGKILQAAIDRNVIIGDFTRKIADIYKDNLELRSKVALELAMRIKERGYLPENDIIISGDKIPTQKAEEEETPASESYIDIDSDVDSE